MGLPTADEAQRRSLGGALQLEGLVPLALVRGVAGVVLIWSWVLVLLFMGDQLALGASAHDRAFATGSLQLCAFAGAALGLGILSSVVRRASRGPEPTRLVANAVSSAVAAFLVVSALVPVPCVLFMALWFVAGLTASYAVRRSVALVESYAEGVSAPRCARFVAYLLVGASVLSAFASRMDATALLLFCAACVPAALALLPQGRLSIMPRSASARADLALMRSEHAAGHVALPCVVGALAVVSGFHTAIGDYLWAGGGPATAVYVVVLAGAALSAFVVVRLSPRHLLFAAQALFALTAVGLVPLLFIDYDPLSTLRTLCQNVLVFLVSVLFVLAAVMIVRGVLEGDAVPTDGRSGLAASALFFVGLVLGWLAGTVAARQLGGNEALFQVAVLVVMLLLLAAVVVMGGLHVACPTAMPPAAQVPPAQPTAFAAAATDDADEDDPQQETNPVEQRCNEVAWRFGLSQREHDILILLAEGLTAQQVADRAFVSRNTVKSHMAHIYAKVGVHTRAELNDLLGILGPEVE